MLGFKILTVYMCVMLLTGSAIDCAQSGERFCLRDKQSYCHGAYGQMCTNDVCGTDKVSCDYLNGLYLPFNSFMSVSVYRSRMLTYNTITSRLARCPSAESHANTAVCSNVKFALDT